MLDQIFPVQVNIRSMVSEFIQLKYLNMNRYVLKILIYFICFGAYQGYAQEAKIMVTTNYKDVCQLVLRPMGMIPMYDHATASLNDKGEGTITFDPQVQLLAELLCENEQGRPMRRVILYIKPGKSLQVNFQKVENKINAEIHFGGELATENEILQSIRRANEQETAILNEKNYTSKFKEHMLKVSHLAALEKEIGALKFTDKNYTKVLKELLQLIKQDNCWQSLPDWPRTMDNIFGKIEEAGLLKTHDDLAKRLDCIGDEIIKCRYGIYKAKMIVNGRHWFENPPIEVLNKLKPYMTTPEMKKELDDILSNYNRVCADWEHFRTAPAPDFTFEDTEGNMVTLSDFRGKFVLLDVWNIYCGPCRDQVPILRELEPELKKMGVEVIGVSCDPQGIKDKWKEVVKEQNMSGIQTIMDNGRESAFMNDYCIIGFPTFILINPDGMVVNPYMCCPDNEKEFMPYIKQKIKEYKK